MVKTIDLTKLSTDEIDSLVDQYNDAIDRYIAAKDYELASYANDKVRILQESYAFSFCEDGIEHDLRAFVLEYLP